MFPFYWVHGCDGFPRLSCGEIGTGKQMGPFKCHSSVWPSVGNSTVLSLLLNLPSITVSNLKFCSLLGLTVSS